jgi:hypothetical protein
MRIDIVGSGAIPSYYGAKLANAGSVAAGGQMPRTEILYALLKSISSKPPSPAASRLPLPDQGED